MRSQRESETFRHGEGTVHERAKFRLRDILSDDRWDVVPDYPLKVQVQQGPWRHMKDIRRYQHEFDIYAEKAHDNGLQSELIVEIDGSSHQKRIQQNKDRKAEDYAAFFFPDAKFKRIDIGILLNPNVADANILDLLK